MITHRCMGSLKARVSIRYEKGWNFKDGRDAWWMYQPLYDYEWDTTVLTTVAEIRFCPFCGQKLEEPKEG